MVLDPATGLDLRIVNMRSHVAASYGLILPEIRLTDDAGLPPGSYRIRIQGVEQARDRIHPDRVLALLTPQEAPQVPGLDVREPVYGAGGRWVDPAAQDGLALEGVTVVGPTEVLATHLLEVIRRNMARLLTLRGLRRILDEATNLSDRSRAEANRRILDELIPDKVSIDLLLPVLRLLLDERVSIRNLPLILDAVAETRGAGGPEAVCEHVRRRLGFQMVAELRREDGSLPLLQLAPDWEDTFAACQLEGSSDVALPPDTFNRLTAAVSDKIAQAGERGIQPAVITSARRRRFLRTVLAARGIAAPVLSYDELGTDARPAVVGLVAA
jgi:flagellar biosynthesis protein FlhA